MGIISLLCVLVRVKFPSSESLSVCEVTSPDTDQDRTWFSPLTSCAEPESVEVGDAIGEIVNDASGPVPATFVALPVTVVADTPTESWNDPEEGSPVPIPSMLTEAAGSDAA